MVDLTQKQKVKWIEDSKQNPLQWVHKVLGISKLSKGEAEILNLLPRAIAERKPLVIPSGHAQGKDFIASCISPWFLYNYYPSKVIITAPTDRQVKEIMWGEIEKRWNDATVPLSGRLLKCKIDVEPDWFMLGFTTKETSNMTGKFQGFHSPNICVIVSEAQAVSDQIFEQMKGILTSQNNLQILIGNPLRTSGTFAKMIKNTTDNIVLQLDCLDSPNYKQQKEVIPGMASYEWVEARRKEWGEEHPLWYSRVRGLLPKVGIDSLFTPDLIDRMLACEPRVVVRKVVVSCDPAGHGDDECVIQGHISGRVIKQDIMPFSLADAVVSHILQMVNLIGANHIAIDADGLGQPIADFLRKLKPSNIYLEEIHGQGERDPDSQYANLRAEIWDYAKREAEAARVSIPDDDYLKEELQEVTYFFNERGKFQLEKKEDIKERLGRSPGRADAWVIGVWAQKSSATVYTVDRWRDNDYAPNAVITHVKSAMTA